MDRTIPPRPQNERLTNLLLISLDILHPAHSPSSHKGRWITLFLLLLEVLLPPSFSFLKRQLPHWLCICVVLATASWVGNLDRRRWLYALTAASLSPIAYKAFWPLRDLCRDDERVAEVTLTANSLLLSAVLMFSGLYASVSCVFVPKTEPPAVLARPAIPKESSDLSDEGPPPPLVVHLARRPAWLTKTRPSALKLSMYPVLGPTDPAGDFASQQKKEPMKNGLSTRRRGRKAKSHAAFLNLSGSADHRPDNFDEDYDVTPDYRANTSSSPVDQPIHDDAMDIATPSTPAWARVDRMPPTPLSAAHLEHFVAPKGPSPRVMETQVMASWTPIGDWLCDPMVDVDEKWKIVRQTIDSWRETCKRLSAKRIARYSIGTSADTTEIVLGPLHLSMHDVLDFFEQSLHEQDRPRDLAKELVRLSKDCIKTLGGVAIELVHMARDYPQNHLIATMARLAAKTTRAAEWRRKTLDLYATEGHAVRPEFVEPEGLSGDPADPTSIAKQDFMTKILKLGHEAQERETAWAARDTVALKKAGLVDAGQYERESQRRQAAQASKSDGASEAVEISDRIFKQRIEPWMDTVFEVNPYGLLVAKPTEGRAATLPFETLEEGIDKPHASKSRRREGRSEDDRLLDRPADETPSQSKRGADGKRMLSDTQVEAEELSQTVYRARTLRPGRKMREQKENREMARALEAGELTGFEKFVAENRVGIRATGPQSEIAPEMEDEIAAAEGVMATGLEEDQQTLQEGSAAVAQGAGETAGQAQSNDRGPPLVIEVPPPPGGDGADQGPAVSGTIAPKQQSPWKPPGETASETVPARQPPAPTVEDAEDSDEEL